MTTRQTPEAVREAQALEIARDLMVKHFGPGKSNANPASWVIEAMLTFAALDSRAGDAGEGEAANRVIYLLQGDNSRMAGALRSCRDQFAFYAREHTAAGKSEKAATNTRFAKIADDALTAIKPATPAPAVDAVPAGEVERLREALAAEAKDWRHSAYSRVTFAHMYDRLSAALSHGEGRK